MVIFNKPVSEKMDNIYTTVGKDSGEINASEIKYPTLGVVFGKIEIPELKISQNLVFGDSNPDLKKGVGMFAGSHFPGESSTCLIAGHNDEKFNALKNVKDGMQIIISTNYGKYVYKISKTKVAEPTDTSAYDLDAPVDNIILYTCYPFDAPGFKTKRLFVYGEYVSGPKINIYK